MSQKWNHRKDRLRQLLYSYSHHDRISLNDEFDQEDADGLALDRLLHGQTVIGQTARTKEIGLLKFGDADLKVLGTLEKGQFGVIDVVSYRYNDKAKLYIRKTISKSFALRTRHQNSPTTERFLLLLAHRTKTPWAPHLVAAFHSSTHLSLIIPYAPLGSLWDLLSSSPLSPVRIREEELKWWVPQVVCAIAWCHEQGYAHRDVKPHNFVITEEKRILILDFGSAAPVHDLDERGHRTLSKEHCQVPVGTCDYVSPEILKAHEAALVRLELEEEAEGTTSKFSFRNGSSRGSLHRTPAVSLVRKEDEVYGLETDWWSMGAMLYELAFGVAPFFAEDIGKTYIRIMDFKRSLRFDSAFAEITSVELKDLLKGVLTDVEFRIGRERGLDEFKEHPWFNGVSWDTLHRDSPPEDLHLPQFVYADPNLNPTPERHDLSNSHTSHSQGFGFSAFFQSSYTTMPASNSFSAAQKLDGIDQNNISCEDEPGQVTPLQNRKQTITWSTPGLSILHSRSCSTSDNLWIGFSWGPTKDAFTSHGEDEDEHFTKVATTPKPQRSSGAFLSPILISTPRPSNEGHTTPFRAPMPMPTPGTFRTPFRTPYQTQTLPILGHGGTGWFYTPNSHMATPGPGVTSLTGTARRRPLSDRQAMAKLVDCIGMSARKRVEESGRKCRILSAGFTPAGTGGGGAGKERGTGARGFDLRKFASGADFASSTAGKGAGARTIGGGNVTRRKSEGSDKKLRFALKDEADSNNDKSGYPDYSSLAFSDFHNVGGTRRLEQTYGNESEAGIHDHDPYPTRFLLNNRKEEQRQKRQTWNQRRLRRFHLARLPHLALVQLHLARCLVVWAG
ncbi:kinase-like protein [Marasmius fiardii PR-910]|nr:kinase-like protein [Marasmius fiardii PR-910]